MNPRRLVVSDIHGEGHRLVQVLAKAEYDPGRDRLFLLGDYIDRGTDSAFTLSLVKTLVADGAIALRGNHEEFLLASVRDRHNLPLWVQNGGNTTIRDFGGILREQVDFVAGLPVYHEEPDCIMVHAGLLPGLPLAEQSEQDMLWMREPFISDYKGKLVIFGHTPTPHLHDAGSLDRFKPWHGCDKVGIDTAAVYGGPLTLVNIDDWSSWTA